MQQVKQSKNKVFIVSFFLGYLELTESVLIVIFCFSLLSQWLWDNLSAKNIKTLLKRGDLYTTSTKKWEKGKFRLKYLTLSFSDFLDILNTTVEQDQRNVNWRLAKAGIINNYENYSKQAAEFCRISVYICLLLSLYYNSWRWCFDRKFETPVSKGYNFNWKSGKYNFSVLNFTLS